MYLPHGREGGQSTVEFALIGVLVMMLTVGLIGVGLAFYQYNNVAAAALYGARWGSVVGGTCSGARGQSTSDWCNQLGQASSSDFWNTPGNYPLQGPSACPSTIQYQPPNPPPTPNPYYLVSSYMTQKSTTIVGAIGQRFDTSATSSNLIVGGLTPGFDLSKLLVCIQLPTEQYSSSSSKWQVGYGSIVTVFVYYQYTPIGAFFDKAQLNLIASSQYQVE